MDIMGLGSGSNEGGEGFRVEEPDGGVYNPTGQDPPVWQPAPQDILLMLDQLDKDQVLPLKWVCPGRRPPEADAPEQPLNDMSDGEEGDDGKEEEKRVPEPSAFDFDDTASEASAKVKITPRTPVQAKRPEKKVACMDSIISSLKRQQKAEREARKSQARSLGMTGFRGCSSSSGTPSRMSGFSPSTSPQVSAGTSPVPVSPRGSPRVPAAVSSPPSRGIDGGESAEKKQTSAPGSPSPTVVGGASTSPPSRQGSGAPSPAPTGAEASRTEADTAVVGPALPASSSPAGDMTTTTTTTTTVCVKTETDKGGASADLVPMETDEEHAETVAVKQE